MPEEIDIDIDNTEGQDSHIPSHLFLVRLWSEKSAEGDTVWCGKVQHVLKGRAAQFRDWPALMDIFVEMLPDAARVSQHREEKHKK